MRTKTSKIGNAEYEVAPLTVDQVEKYTTPFKEADGSEEQKAALRRRAHEMICDGLNNALGKWKADEFVYPDGVTGWTPERITRELDFETIRHLREEVLSLSNLKIVDDAADTKKPGEAAAA